MTTIDLTNLDPAIRALAAEALPGPWEAVLAYSIGGEVITPDDIAGVHADDLEDVVVAIVRGSAAPTGPDADGIKRLPGSYNGGDLLVEFDTFECPDEIVARWIQAQAMAAGLNLAAAEVAR